MRRIISLIGLLLMLMVSNAQETIYDIIKTDSCPGVEISNEITLYVGDDLFNLINGGAELYHEYGFVEVLACKAVAEDGGEVKIEIYDMGSPDAAWGIYSMTATSNAQIFKIGSAGRQGIGFSQFVKGKYMVYLYHDQVDETDIGGIAACIARNIGNHDPRPELLNAVESGRDDPEKLVYFVGNLGLSSIYNFHYKDVFAYSEGAAAVYPDLKVFLLKYEDEAYCIEHYNVAREFFMNNSKYHDQVTLRGSFHMKDRKEQQIDCYLENTLLLIFISSGEEDLNAIRETIVQNMHFPVTGNR